MSLSQIDALVPFQVPFSFFSFVCRACSVAAGGAFCDAYLERSRRAQRSKNPPEKAKKKMEKNKTNNLSKR